MRNDMVTVAQAAVRLDDPHLTTDNRDRLGIRAAICESLVARRTDGSFAPALASSWNVADDVRTWRFVPRDGVRFHDGSPCRGEDIVASLERVCDPGRSGELGTGGVIQSYLAGATFEVHADGSVSIITAEPMADLLDLLADLPVLSHSTTKNHGEYPVGTGPYRLEDVTDGQIDVVRWDGYWGDLPSHASVRWVREADPHRRVDMLLDESVAIISDVPLNDLDRIAASDRHRAVTAPSTTAVAFICNAAMGVCADRRVRQALNFGLDVDAVIAATGRIGATPLNGPLTRLHLGDDPALLPYRYDPARARALLTQAGYGNGLQLTLDVPERLPDEAPVLGQILAEQFAMIGVETVVRSFSDRPGYAEMVRAKQIDDACCFDSTPISTYRVLREKLHGRVCGPWWQGYHNPEVDFLLDAAAGTPALDDRQVLYRRAYRLIHDDAPWLFLYSPRLTWAAAVGANFSPTPIGLIQFI